MKRYFKKVEVAFLTLKLIGEDDEVIKKLRGIASGELPLSSNDFTHKK